MPTNEATPRSRGELVRTMIVVLLFAVLLGTSLWILEPFLLAIVWATTIVVATWPLMIEVQVHVRRRAFAVAMMTAAMLLVFIVPLLLAIGTLVDNIDTITRIVTHLASSPIPSPPDWLASVPLVGEKVAARWSEMAALGKEHLAAQLAPYSIQVAGWLAARAGGFGLLTLHFLLTVVIAAILYANGETAREALLRLGRRVGGARGEGAMILAGQAIRAVALGVVVTALVQTVLAGIGLAVAGIPGAGLLTGVILLLCIAQIGPLLVLVPCVAWLFWTGATVWGTALLVWTVVVGSLDNVLRPMLIRRGADVPLLLIFAGVIGGLLAFGVVGLFVGPVVLAVTYRFIGEWVADDPAAAQGTLPPEVPLRKTG